jgi:hypothetical protein
MPILVELLSSSLEFFELFDRYRLFQTNYLYVIPMSRTIENLRYCTFLLLMKLTSPSVLGGTFQNLCSWLLVRDYLYTRSRCLLFVRS